MSLRETRTDSRDESLVRQLLGRRPKISYHIICRCPDGCPQVLETPPLVWENNRWVPFPTIYWLTCPRLKLEISRLEQAGWIKSLAERVKNQTAAWQEYQDAQEAVALRRVQAAKTLLGQDPEPGVIDILTRTTIAGSHHIAGIKCLHAHVAHFLASGDNPIGRWALDAAGACRPELPCLSLLKTELQEETP